MQAKHRHYAALSDAVTPLEKQNQDIAYRAALEGIVLLQNDGTLPLTPGAVALYGAGAGMTIKGGTGSGEVNERHAVSVLEGLEAVGFQVTTKKWIDEYHRLYDAGEEAYGVEFRKKLRRLDANVLINLMSNPYRYPFGQPITEEDVALSQTDTCIYVVARQAGEGADRKLDNGDNSLSETEKSNIALCAQRYAKTIVVINIGSSFDMGFLDEIPGINAVVFLGQQGAMGGMAFADLICGKATPSGKLTDSWAYRYEDIPFADEYSYLNGNLEQEYYKEGIYVGYRYFDSFGVVPRYPFGYGLSYTEFSLRLLDVRTEDTHVALSVSVANEGRRYAGQEVVQLYASCPQGDLPKEYQRLAAFAKSRVLAPGESEQLTLRFNMAELSSYRQEDAAAVLAKGRYLLRVGNSSRNTQVCAVLELDGEAVVSRHAPICPCAQAVPELATPALGAEEIPADTPVLQMPAQAFQTVTHTDPEPPPSRTQAADALLERLTLKEAVELTVGAGLSGPRYFEAPGTAGATSGRLLAKGIPNICVADGPAGLRLQKTSAVNQRGKVKPIDPYISLMKYFPAFTKRFTFGNPEKDTLIYQFTTAFPVGLALAQTWNLALLEEVGRAVGREMDAYGISYWLAPALNLHRNPLCGRNYEYYSEDPLLSGKLAGAITRGVQSVPGSYVTLKHFCCNNQEDNRNKTNANVSERTLRELYLRGFEIAVKEGRPGAVMSSYNKVNGVYASNNHDLLTKVLRCEWGFEGFVMTDWFATGKGLASPVLAMQAGNDLLMPGNGSEKKAILKAVARGQLEEKAVRRCAAHVLAGILQTKLYKDYAKSAGGKAYE